MTFILQELKESQFLSPAIQTEAIVKLTTYMNDYVNRVNRTSNDKPTCAQQRQAIPANAQFLQECGREANPFIKIRGSNSIRDRREVFPIALQDCSSCISQQLDLIQPEVTEIKVSIPDYISPTLSGPPSNQNTMISDAYQTLTDKMASLNRLLVIHLDDCQKFFCGQSEATRTVVDKKGIEMVQVGKVMGLAFRLFAREVSSLGICAKILWIFSGTRLNLDLEMKVASEDWRTFDISNHLCDFDINHVRQIFQSYFLVEDTLEIERLERLCGPPKLISFFIQSSYELRNESRITLQSVQDLIQKWAVIESRAIDIYREQIQSTINRFKLQSGDMELYARNLCLLHTHGFINNETGFLNFEKDFPASWLPFTEAGLIRTRRNGFGCQLYPPNRFLVQIFNDYVKWFTMKNVKDLVSAIKFSSSDHTAKGKVFEYMFALEICSPTDSSLWKELGKFGLKPLTNWLPSVQKMGSIDSAIDKSKVYVIIDPDRSKSKTDILFFATSIKSTTEVRVLAQLTIQKQNSTEKARSYFQGMMSYLSLSVNFLLSNMRRLVFGTTDFLLFVSPRSTVNFPPEHKSAFQGSDCHWLDSSTFSSLLRFSLDLCDPEKTDDSLKMLTNFALSLDDKALASWIQPELKKRKRGFHSMDDFYKALSVYGLNEGQNDQVKAILEMQEILPIQLATLTNAKLLEDGMHQRGLRDAVLSIIENV